MAIVYKIDIIEALKNNGYSTYQIQKQKLLNQTTMQKFRNGNTNITVANVNTICTLLNCQPGDILEYIPDVDN